MTSWWREPKSSRTNDASMVSFVKNKQDTMPNIINLL